MVKPYDHDGLWISARGRMVTTFEFRWSFESDHGRFVGEVYSWRYQSKETALASGIGKEIAKKQYQIDPSYEWNLIDETWK